MGHINKKFKAARGNCIIALIAVFVFWGFVPAFGLGPQIDLKLNCKNPSYLCTLSDSCGLSFCNSDFPWLRRNLSFYREIEIHPDSGWVGIQDKLGNYEWLYHPMSLKLNSYKTYTNRLGNRQNWLTATNTSMRKAQNQKAGGIFQFEIPVKFPKAISRIIGEGGPGLKVTGNRRITLAGRSQWTEGLVSTATSKQSRFPTLNMKQEYNFNITGTIGKKISVQVDQDSRRMTDLENNIRLRYTGEEDEIIKNIELGNTNLSVAGKLINYSEQVKGLFGIKAQAKLGGLDLTVITSQDKGSTDRAVFKAGAERSEIKIRDVDYLHGKFFYLGKYKDLDSSFNQNDFYVGDSILEIRVFKSNDAINGYAANPNTPTFLTGKAYVNPKDTTEYPNESWGTKFVELSSSEYWVSLVNDSLRSIWIMMSSPLGKGDVLAVYYRIQHTSGSITVIDTVGNMPDTTSGDSSKVMLKLIKTKDPLPTMVTWKYEWKNIYDLKARSIDKENLRIRIFLTGGIPNPAIDPDNQDKVTFINLLGLDTYDQFGDPKPDGLVDGKTKEGSTIVDYVNGLLFFPKLYPFKSDTLKVKVDEVYDKENENERSKASKYYIFVETTSRRSEYSLGKINILPGTDVVTLNGKRLTPGADYNLDYEMGTITFLNEQALDPNANLTVDYEFAPLFLVEKKSLFGIKGEYDLGNLKLSTTAIYKNEKTAEERPRVGQEPVRNFVWNTGLAGEFEFNPFTKLANALPLVETDAPSKLDFTLEIAQSIPNPNLKNKAYIDDFEGSLEYTDLGVRRGIWTLSSPPVNVPLKNRSRMYWYNLIDRVDQREIWPNKSTARGEEKIDVLSLEIFPNNPSVPYDTINTPQFDTTSLEKNWNGVMRPFGNYDQTRTRFLEIWVRGDYGILNVDLGKISEDVNGDGKLNTEDIERNGQLDNILQADEDNGIDGVPDSLEPNYNSTTNPDPNRDDWNYSNKDDYSQINGTEGNKDDPDRAYRLDTEDLNGNNNLDVLNDYFQFSVNLADSTFLVPGSKNNGWRLYRIPIKELSDTSLSENFKIEGTPDWNRIQYARIWINGFNQHSLIQIASIMLTGNRWEPEKIASLDSIALPVDSTKEKANVFVINTNENSEYEPPPGIAGVLNRETNVREKEQSLVLRYDSLQYKHSASATRIFLAGTGEFANQYNYTNYARMKLYYHGPDTIISDSLNFFFRVGTDVNNFYEYHSRVTTGWNEITIDFSEITALKSYMQINHPPGGKEIPDTTAGQYRVRGNPSLSAVKWLNAGVVNLDPLHPASGEIWLDELRVTEIRKVPGWALEGTLSGTVADLFTFGLTGNYKDAEFHNLAEKVWRPVVNRSVSANMTTYLEKFTPPSWGLRLPLTIRWTKGQEIPRLKTGSDIVLPDELKKKEQSQSGSLTVGFGPSIQRNSKNWFWNATLNRFSLGQISYTKNYSTNPTTPEQTTETYSTSANYDLSQKETSFSPFGWLKGTFFPKKIVESKIVYLPTKLNFRGDINRSRNNSINSAGIPTSSYTRTFNGSVEAGINPLKNSTITYALRTTRDLRNPNLLKLSLKPKEFMFGLEVSRSQDFRTSYKIQLFSLIDPNFSFSSNYGENADPSQNAGGTRRITNGNTKSIDFTFNHLKLFQTSSKKDSTKSFALNPLPWLKKGFSFLRKFSPPKVTYRVDRRFGKGGLLKRPSLLYQFGLTQSTGVGFGNIDPKLAAGDGFSYDRILTLASGMTLFPGLSLSTDYAQRLNYAKTSTDILKSQGKVFPSIGVTWGNLEKYKLLKKAISNSGMSFKFSRSVEIKGSAKTGENYSRITSKRFSPLVALTVNWKNGVASTLSLDKSIDKSEDLRKTGSAKTVTMGYTTNFGLKNNYSFRAPQGIKLPFLKKIRFQSNLNLGLEVNWTNTKQETSVSGRKFNVTGDNSSLTIIPSATYSFSSQINGGLSGRWIDTNEKLTKKKTHTRELSIFMEIRF